MPNVAATLAYFKGLEGFKTCLLTGNTTTGAYLKLQRYGIDKYFDSHYAVCGELSEDRSELAKIALRRLQVMHPEEEISGSDIFLIGRGALPCRAGRLHLHQRAACGARTVENY